METKYFLFEIPDWIKEGLESKIYTRWSTGVIRRTDNGQIVYHLREIPNFAKPDNLDNKLEHTIEKTIKNIYSHTQLSDIQQFQALQVIGLYSLATICIAGFAYLGMKIDRIENKLDKIQDTLNTINNKLNKIHYDNIRELSNNFFRAKAYYEEKDYDKGNDHALNCSADIEKYFSTVPIEEIIVDEYTLSFLLNTLMATMQCQLLCSYHLDKDKTIRSILRYKNLLLFINNKINTCIIEAKNSNCLIPSYFNIIKLYKNNNSTLYNAPIALPAAVEMLENEQRFIELTKGLEPAQIEAAIANGAKYIGVAEPAT